MQVIGWVTAWQFLIGADYRLFMQAVHVRGSMIPWRKWGCAGPLGVRPRTHFVPLTAVFWVWLSDVFDVVGPTKVTVVCGEGGVV